MSRRSRRLGRKEKAKEGEGEVIKDGGKGEGGKGNALLELGVNDPYYCDVNDIAMARCKS